MPLDPSLRRESPRHRIPVRLPFRSPPIHSLSALLSLLVLYEIVVSSRFNRLLRLFLFKTKPKTLLSKREENGNTLWVGLLPILLSPCLCEFAALPPTAPNTNIHLIQQGQPEFIVCSTLHAHRSPTLLFHCNRLCKTILQIKVQIIIDQIELQVFCTWQSFLVIVFWLSGS
jgi:hypothetical protein